MNIERKPVWATTQKAGEHAGYTKRTIERWIREGLLPAYKTGRAVRVDLNELDDLIIASRVEVKP